ncbi:hypothetical protein BO71DRAFT_472637, partial [Aspergillus ellipticus CBS 707.79]
TNVDLFGGESWEEKVQKWVWSGDDRNVRAVWVRGRVVHRLRDGGSHGWKWGWVATGLGVLGAGVWVGRRVFRG